MTAPYRIKKKRRPKLGHLVLSEVAPASKLKSKNFDIDNNSILSDRWVPFHKKNSFIRSIFESPLILRVGDSIQL